MARRAILVVARVDSRWGKPLPASRLGGTIADLARSNPQLVAEDVLPRQHASCSTARANDRAAPAPAAARGAPHPREATPSGAGPPDLIRDTVAHHGPRFDAVAAGSGIAPLRTPMRAPRANALGERLIGSLRRECLGRILLVGEAHVRRVLREYVRYFNQARPHQGSDQRVPEPGGRE